MSGKGNASNRSNKAGHADKQHPGNNKGCNDVEGPNDPFEDEMITWLQYPLEDTFDRGYCSDLFGQWPNPVTKTPTSGVDVVSAGLSTAMRNAGDEHHVGRGPSLRSNSAEAALALGAGRAAGLIPQADVEAFSRVRTSMQPPPRIIGSQPTGRPFGALYPSSQKRSGRSETATFSSSMPPPRFRNASLLSNKLPLQPTQGRLRTFSSDCPQPSVALRAIVSPTSKLKDDQGKVGSIKITPLGSTISKSSFFMDLDASRKVSDARLEFPSSQETGSKLITEEVTMKRATDCLADNGSGGQLCTTKINVETSGILASAIMENQRIETKAGVCEVPDVALTSCSGGSQASADISTKEASFSGKGKMEDSECLSEEAEGESAETKQPRKRSSKRSRAAEVHNLSERKRRNRINEKMKALQDLIPNANKTDKASMLDEAIEYLKTLQSQLQMVSMRSGMSVPPMMIPSGMPHLQMPQMAPLHPIGLGVPVGHAGMGMGMGLMDWSHGVTGRPFHSLAAPLPHFNIPFQAPTIVDTQNCSQASSSTELSEFQALQYVSPQLSEQPHLGPQNLMYYQLHHQQSQPCPPSHPHSSGMIESSSEQIVQREK